MSTVEITPQLKVQMLKTLIAGHDLDYAAMATEVPRTKVLDIVSAHGYPDHDRMSWAVDMLIQGANRIPERRTVHAQSTVHRPPAVRVDAHPPARPVHPSTAEVLHQAGESTQARTRNLAAKISTLLADLTARLADEQAAIEAQHQAEKENAAVASRIAQLEAEIRKLKDKAPKMATRPPKAARVTAGVHPCTAPGCDRTFDTGQGASLHRRRAHEGWSPRSSGDA